MIIILRHLLLSFTEKKETSSDEDENWNDLIDICALSIGLVSLGHTFLSLKNTPKNAIMILASFLPVFSPAIETNDLLPSV